MENIKDCPFCGRVCHLEETQPSDHRFNEGCIHFKVSCPSLVGEFVSSCVGSSLNTWQCTPEDAISAWNKRPSNKGE